MNTLEIFHKGKMLESSTINQQLSKAYTSVGEIVVPVYDKQQHDYSSIQKKYLAFINNVRDIFDKADVQKFTYAWIYPGTSFKKITSSFDYTIDTNSFNSLIDITQNQTNFIKYAEPIYTHADKSNYILVTEGDEEHSAVFTFSTELNADQHYVLEFEDGTRVNTRNKMITITSKLLENYIVSKYTKTIGTTEYVSQPYAYKVKSENNPNEIITKTANIEPKTFQSIRITAVYIGSCTDVFPFSLDFTLSGVKTGTKVVISPNTISTGVSFKKNEAALETDTSFSVDEKPLTILFESIDSFVEKLVINVV